MVDAVATAGWIAQLSGQQAAVLALFLWVAGYVLSLYLHPFIRCSHCKGTARFYGAVFRRAFRLCPVCGGSGRQERLGVRLTGIGRR